MSLSLSFPTMAKEREKPEKNKTTKMFVGVVWNCAAELKLLLTALLILCTIATLIQLLPPRFSFSTSDLRLCIAGISPSTESPPPLTSPPSDKLLENGVVKRAFIPYGSAAYNFITMGAYRGGVNTFAVVGLASKPLHVYGKPSYRCQWVPHGNTTAAGAATTTDGYKILPDWGYGRVYTVVVVNCTFPEPVNQNNSGGKLLVHAAASGAGDQNLNITDVIDALEEQPGSLDANLYNSEPKYDYLYCGSSLYGELSPQRVREWLAYHVRLFGERSHFVIHDAGGVHAEVLEVLRPWMELGFVTLQDIREQERFDGYYHNQFLVVNDCLHRYKFMAKWMFFFDVDEYIYVAPGKNLRSVMDSLSDHTQFTITQMIMSSKLCLLDDNNMTTDSKWGMEKLVYRDVKKGIRRDRKYAVQPRLVYAAGVHLSQNFIGKTTHKTEALIHYFHYHGTIANRQEPCRSFVNATWLTGDNNVPYVLDTTMRDISGDVKRFELKMIGPRLQHTRQ